MIKAPKARAHRVILREDLYGYTGQVDASQGVIRGVKILGCTSQNTHGLEVSCTEYTREAMNKAKHLYEGINVNKNHPPRESPHKERIIEDRIGWLQNVHVREDGLYGDLHLFTSDPDTAKILEAAQKRPQAFGLSHNAVGNGKVKSGKYVISDIPSVRSVDIVADAGSTRSLFESRKPMTTLRQLLETRFGASGPRVLGEENQDLLDKSVGDDSPDWKDSVASGVATLLKSEDEADHAKAKGMLQSLNTKESEEDDDKDDDDDDKDDDEVTENCDSGKMTKESLQRKVAQLEAEKKALTDEKAVRELCESLQFPASRVQVKAMIGLTDGERRTFIQESKAKKASNMPRSSGAVSVRTVQEPAKDAQQFARMLLN